MQGAAGPGTVPSSLAAWWQGLRKASSLLECFALCLPKLTAFSTCLPKLSFQGAFSGIYKPSSCYRFLGDRPIWENMFKGSNYFYFGSCHPGFYAVSILLWKADVNERAKERPGHAHTMTLTAIYQLGEARLP